MKERWRIGISLAVVFVAGVFVSSHVKGGDPGKEALHIALYGAAYLLLTKALKVFLKRKDMAEGKEKKALGILTFLGHAIVVGILGLCIWAGISYAGQGETKGAAVLLFTAFLLAVSEGVKLKNRIFP